MYLLHPSNDFVAAESILGYRLVSGVDGKATKWRRRNGSVTTTPDPISYEFLIAFRTFPNLLSRQFPNGGITSIRNWSRCDDVNYTT